MLPEPPENELFCSIVCASARPLFGLVDLNAHSIDKLDRAKKYQQQAPGIRQNGGYIYHGGSDVPSVPPANVFPFDISRKRATSVEG
jgi:hypothetical protein